MVIDQIDVKHLAVLKPKYDPPIRPDRNGPEPLQPALEGMQAKARPVEGLQTRCRIEGGENVSDAFDHLCGDVAGIVLSVESF